MTKEIDIAALRKAAQEAQSLVNETYSGGWIDGVCLGDEWGDGTKVTKVEVAYITSTHPAVILALLDRLEHAEKDAAKWRTFLHVSEAGKASQIDDAVSFMASLGVGQGKGE